VASFTIESCPWPVATVVGVYEAAALTAGAAAPSGATVTTGTVSSDGTLELTGLAEDARYVAFAAGLPVRFKVVPSRLREGELSDRERLREIELNGVSGGGAGGGESGVGNVMVNRWDPDTGWAARPDAARVDWEAPFEGDYADPTDLMAAGDQLVAGSLPTDG
jgi:hypothetical protein